MLVCMTERNRLLGVELRHFAALEAVARTHSFSAAARELGYTQSAVSQQIAQLERIVGHRLVDRPGGPRPVSLTEAGELMLRHADSIVARLDAAGADVAALAEGSAGALRIGTYQSVGARLLPSLLRRFRSAWPRLEVRFTEASDAVDLLYLVEHGEIDLTFADLPLPEGPFESEEILRDPYVLLVSARSELAKQAEAPPLRELAGIPMIAWRSWPEPERFLRGRAPRLDVVYRIDDNGTLAALVGEGLGVALVPRLVVNPLNTSVVALPVDTPVPPRTIVLVWHRDRYRPPAAEAFVELALELGADYERRATANAVSAPSAASAASTSRRRGR